MIFNDIDNIAVRLKMRALYGPHDTRFNTPGIHGFMFTGIDRNELIKRVQHVFKARKVAYAELDMPYTAAMQCITFKMLKGRLKSSLRVLATHSNIDSTDEFFIVDAHTPHIHVNVRTGKCEGGYAIDICLDGTRSTATSNLPHGDYSNWSNNLSIYYSLVPYA